jgi:regulation of enolase protein 1 (concanavalin A-like superfamily)
LEHLKTKLNAMHKHFLFVIVVLASCQSEPTQTTASPATTTAPAATESTEKIAWEFTESLNGAKEHMTVDASGKIELTAGAETDFFTEPGQPPYDKANAPLLLRTVDNTKPFTFSFKTSPVHTVKYDAGMAFIYVDDHHWLKFAFEADERMKTRMVTVKTKDFSDDNNHDVVLSKSAYLKISSDTKVVGFYYSEEGTEWQLVRVFKNEYPTRLKIGIGTQSPMGKGNKSTFENFQFSETSVKDFRMGI